METFPAAPAEDQAGGQGRLVAEEVKARERGKSSPAVRVGPVLLHLPSWRRGLARWRDDDPVCSPRVLGEAGGGDRRECGLSLIGARDCCSRNSHLSSPSISLPIWEDGLNVLCALGFS